MDTPKFVHELSRKEKRYIKNGEICFDSQEQKLELLDGSIGIIESVLKEHKKDKDVANYLHFKLLEYFLKEYREILEQYELDITWTDDKEDKYIGEQDESI